jgi:anti-anti-sigma regulatory factor
MAQRADEDILYVDKQLVIRRTYAPEGLSVSGSIDVFNVDAFAKTLASCLPGAGDLKVDLQYLEFCDVSGIRAMVSAATRTGEGRRMVVHGLPNELRSVMALVGWSDLPGLVVIDPEEAGS